MSESNEQKRRKDDLPDVYEISTSSFVSPSKHRLKVYSPVARRRKQDNPSSSRRNSIRNYEAEIIEVLKAPEDVLTSCSSTSSSQRKGSQSDEFTRTSFGNASSLASTALMLPMAEQNVDPVPSNHYAREMPYQFTDGRNIIINTNVFTSQSTPEDTGATVNSCHNCVRKAKMVDAEVQCVLQHGDESKAPVETKSVAVMTESSSTQDAAVFTEDFQRNYVSAAENNSKVENDNLDSPSSGDFFDCDPLSEEEVFFGQLLEKTNKSFEPHFVTIASTTETESGDQSYEIPSIDFTRKFPFIVSETKSLAESFSVDTISCSKSTIPHPNEEQRGTYFGASCEKQTSLHEKLEETETKFTDENRPEGNEDHVSPVITPSRSFSQSAATNITANSTLTSMKSNIFKHPFVLSPKIDIASLDTHARNSLDSCSQTLNNGDSDSERLVNVKKAKSRAKKLWEDLQNASTSEGEPELDYDEQKASKSSSSSKKRRQSKDLSPLNRSPNKKRARVLESSDNSSSETEKEIQGMLKMPKLCKKKCNRDLMGDLSRSRDGSFKESALLKETNRISLLRSFNVESNSEESDVAQSENEPLCSKLRNQSGHQSVLVESDYFDEVDSGKQQISNSRFFPKPADSGDSDENLPLGEFLSDQVLTLGSLEDTKTLASLKKNLKCRKSEQLEKSSLEQSKSDSQATVVLSSDSESERNKSQQVVIVKRSCVPDVLRRASMCLAKDPTLPPKQSKLKFKSTKKGTDDKRGIKTIYKRECIRDSEDSDVDSYVVSTDEQEVECLSKLERPVKIKNGSILSSNNVPKKGNKIGKGKYLFSKVRTKPSATDQKTNLNREFRPSDSDASENENNTEETNLVSMKSRKKCPRVRRKRLHVEADVSDDDGSPKKRQSSVRKVRKARAILSERELNKETRLACKAERERMNRLRSISKEGLVHFDVIDGQKVFKQVWLEKSMQENAPLVDVNESVAVKLKEHQVQGIQFMYDCTVESVKMARKSEGGGCILAHCMGLGKTLQVVAFLEAVLNSGNLKFNHALIIAPCSTLFNWQREFKIWLGRNLNFSVINLDKYKTNKDYQMDALKYWHLNGGVLIVGYEAFALMVKGCLTEEESEGKPMPKCKRPMKEEHKEIVFSALVDPGPDFVVCDEGHELKNDNTTRAKMVNMLRTRRRIVLTGTPLQNNLNEYYVMGSFVKPHLLGTKKEFRNRFTNPITQGQQRDADAIDVKKMQKQAHVLHKQLSGCVDRKDFSYIKTLLAPKYEYTIEIRLTPLQIKLYQRYLELFVQDATQAGTQVDEMDEFVIKKSATQGGNLLNNRNVLMLILAHPIAATKAKRITKTSKKELREELGDIAEVVQNQGTTELKEKSGFDGAEGVSPPSPDTADEDWKKFLLDQLSDKLSSSFDLFASGKFFLLCEILRLSQARSDKVIVFSQSLVALTLIEDMLALLARARRENWKKEEGGIDGLEAGDCEWRPGKDYLRLDGSKTTDERKHICKSFNDPKSTNKLMLISTKAGSLGLNLVTANRVIIFDASWNPTDDIQAMFRAYRFGQTKPVYIYRFIGQGTIEQKVYFRQIVKVSLSERVVDKNAKERRFTKDEVSELYRFSPVVEQSPLQTVPQDKLLADLVLKHGDKWIGNYYEHDTLLQDDADDLDEEEKRLAWEEYERDRERARTPPPLEAINPHTQTLPMPMPVVPPNCFSDADKIAALPPPSLNDLAQPDLSSKLNDLSKSVGTVVQQILGANSQQQNLSLPVRNFPGYGENMRSVPSLGNSHGHTAQTQLPVSSSAAHNPNQLHQTVSQSSSSKNSNASVSSRSQTYQPGYLNSSTTVSRVILENAKKVMLSQVLNVLKGKINVSDAKKHLDCYYVEKASSIRTHEDLKAFKNGAVPYVRERLAKS